MLARIYLRASTKEQDATRAKAELKAFAKQRGLTIASFYPENESGASLQRPELFRLLSESEPGDILLVEQVDRLSRLNEADWNKLRAELSARQLRVVALDLPTSWTLTNPDPEGFNSWMFAAINGMMLDVLAAVARKDYEDRRRRQAQGIAKAKADNVYRGRPEDTERNAGIISMLRSKQSWNSIVAATGCSRSTLARLSKRINDEAPKKRTA